MVNDDTKFVRVKCSDCKTSQIIFGKASTKLKCSNLKCNKTIAEPSSGKAKIRARVEEILN
jgi:small subunit ribosomal protein S27e